MYKIWWIAPWCNTHENAVNNSGNTNNITEDHNTSEHNRQNIFETEDKDPIVSVLMKQNRIMGLFVKYSCYTSPSM